MHPHSTPQQRFWSKVNKNGPIPELRPDLGPCWLWLGALSCGYGSFHLGAGSVFSHRLAYEWAVGPIPDDLTIDHLCRNRACVNHSHMEPVSRGENVRRGEAGEINRFRLSGRTRCIVGHVLAGSNLYVSADGRRHCRLCARRRARVYRARQKGQRHHREASLR